MTNPESLRPAEMTSLNQEALQAALARYRSAVRTAAHADFLGTYSPECAADAVRKEAEAERAVLAALPQAGEPVAWVTDGYKLIKREPTDEMMSAGLYQSSHDATYADVYSAWVDMWDVAIPPHPEPDAARREDEPEPWPKWADDIRKKLRSYGINVGPEDEWDIGTDFEEWIDGCIAAAKTETLAEARREAVMAEREACAQVVERIRTDRDNYERRMAGWDDPTVPDLKRRSWLNPAAKELDKAAAAIRARAAP